MRTLRCAGVPSSSTASAPHSGPMVPSSTRVTSGLATVSPMWWAKTDSSLAMWSASRPCPHASWNSTPPEPLAITTGRVAGGGAGQLLDLVAGEQLEADRPAHALPAGLHAGVAKGHAGHRHPGADLVVGDVHPVAVGHQDLPAPVAVAGAYLADGRAGRPGRL